MVRHLLNKLPRKKTRLIHSNDPDLHKGIDSGGTLRAAVFGVNDGLVSNTSLILGVAGATNDAKAVIIAGMAGLLAGAFSMAAGEYISMNSQRELFENQIRIEKREQEQFHEEETQELALIYIRRGIPKRQAHALARRMMKDPKHALDVHVREELGLNPDDLGSPWGAAFSSFLSFTIGGSIPLIPFFFGDGNANIVAAAAFGVIGLFFVGMLLSRFTGKNPLVSGLRMMLIGCLAGATTYLIGSWLGVRI